MDDGPANTLRYGHLGTAQYLPDAQSWEFSRGLKNERTLTLLDGLKVYPSQDACREPPLHKKSGLLPSKEENLLLDVHPQLAPSFGIIGRYEASSRAVTENASQLDPLVSSCFVLGNASIIDENRVGERTIPIVVFRSGDSPSSLLLFPLDAEDVEWPAQDGTGSVEVPSIDYKEEALWTWGGGPIQQVALSESVDEKSRFVAVRLPASTVILRPLYRRSLPTVDDILFSGDKSNSLDANPLIEIPNSWTGFQPHADITFNPWYQRQMAIIDCFGNWSIWNLQGRQPHKGYWNAERGPRGSLAACEIPEQEKDHYDGWAAISWAGNVHQLIVCDRRNVVLFCTDVYPPEEHAVDLRFEGRSEWVLSLCRSKYNSSHVFIVTSTRVFWVSVVSEDLDNRTRGKTSILLSWRHFRDIEDTSLTTTTVLIQNEIYLVLYSRLNTLAQLFRFSMSVDHPSIPVSVSDPSVFPLPRNDPSGGLHKNAENGPYLSMILKEIAQTAIPDPLNAGYALKMIKFVGQRTDAKVVESLYCAKIENRDGFEELASSDSIVPSRRKGPSSMLSSARAGDDDFVVEDRDKPAIASRQPAQCTAPRRLGYSSQRLEQWLDQYAAICSALQDSIVGRGPKLQTPDFNEWLELLPAAVQSSVHEGAKPTAPNTMFDIFEDVPTIEDIDENSHQFETIIRDLLDPARNPLHAHRLVYMPLPWSSVSGLSPNYFSTESYNLNIAELYDGLVHDWLSSLPENIPGKIRVAKERTIRTILTELIMSRIVVICSVESGHDYPVSSGKDPDPPEQDSTLPSTFTEASSSQNFNSTPPSSQPQSQPSYDENFASTYSTLRRYTSVNTQSPLSKRVATTISHWQEGADPSTYDWKTAIRAFHEDDDSQTEDSQPNYRRKKRAARRQKEQVERASQVSNPSSSVPPAVKIGGSQPEGLFQPRSSQAAEEDMPIMSQIVRGPFGGREGTKGSVAKARKKRRAAGF